MSASYATAPSNLGSALIAASECGDIMVCNDCFATNRDGIVPETYPHLAVHLEVRRIQPEKISEGWILWPSN